MAVNVVRRPDWTYQSEDKRPDGHLSRPDLNANNTEDEHGHCGRLSASTFWKLATEKRTHRK